MILVTGATGLVGSHLLLHLLQNGEDVRALYKTEENIQKTKALFNWKNQSALFQKINWLQGCITDIPSLEIAFENIDYVYHCAAVISFNPDDEEQLRKVNIEGTANIVNFCLAKNVKKLCYVSSIAALGDLNEPDQSQKDRSAKSQIITEETEWNPEKPHSDYGITKYGAEMEVWRGQEEGLKTVIINPGIILGPGFWKNGSSEIFIRIKKGLKYYTKGATGFTTVKDVVKIMHALMKSDIEKERFIVVSEIIPFEKLSRIIAKSLGKKEPYIYLDPWMTSVAWRLDYIISVLFFKKRELSRATAKAMHTQSNFDNSKIKNALNFKFESIETYISEIKETY